MKNNKNISSDQPVQDLSRRVEQEAKEKIVQQTTKILNTNTEVKRERTAEKLDKKEAEHFLKNVSMEDLVNLQNENKSTKVKENVNSSSHRKNVKFMLNEDPLKKNTSDQEVTSKVLKESQRQEKLEKKLHKQDLKLNKSKDKIGNLNEARALKKDAYNELEAKTRSRIQSPFSTPVIGERTTLAKVASSPTKITSKSGKALKDNLNKDIENSEEGVKLADAIVSSSSTMLRKNTVKTFNETVGFDRKAKNLLKLEKEESKLQKKTIKETKKSYKANNKKYKYGDKQIKRNMGVLETAKSTVNDLIASFGEPSKLIGNIMNGKKKVILIGSLVLLMGTTAIIVPVSALFMGSHNVIHRQNNVIVYEEADIIIDLDSPHYQGKNPYTSSGYRGQCTWYVWGRVHELYDKRLPSALGNGGDWIDNIKDNPNFTISDIPKTHSIMVLKNNTGKESDRFGHVAFVESYDPATNLMIVSEANIGNIARGTPGMIEEARKNYDKYFNLEIDVKGDITKMHGITIVGYIYIDDFVGGE